MKIKVLGEAGHDWAMLGLSLSYDQPVENMHKVALTLLSRGGSHLKFLESMIVWLDITAARYWWQQFDTYRVGVSKQSGSTMHTLTKRPLTQADFEGKVIAATVERLDFLIEMDDLEQAKAELPEGFLQKRIVCTNYQTLRRILKQRLRHRLPEWGIFRQVVLAQVKYPKFLEEQ